MKNFKINCFCLMLLFVANNATCFDYLDGQRYLRLENFPTWIPSVANVCSGVRTLDKNGNISCYKNVESYIAGVLNKELFNSRWGDSPETLEAYKAFAITARNVLVNSRVGWAPPTNNNAKPTK